MYQPKTISSDMLASDGKYLVYGANGIIGRYNEYNHEQPEVLMTCRGATCGTINISQPYSWINGNAMVVHPKNYNLGQAFLKYLLQGIDLSVVITGAAQPQITRQSLKPVKIVIPPIAEQEKIVAELDCLTGIIEKKKQQLEELDKLAQSIFYDMFGDPITNEKGWSIGSFGEIMTVAKVERCGEREGLPVLSITMRNGIVRQSERFKKVIASKDVSAYKVVPRGCLVIAFPIDEGLIYVQDVDNEGIMSPAYNVWDVNYAKVQMEYLVAYFHSAYAMKYYKDKLRGTTQRRRMLAKEDLLSMPIPLPPMAIQNHFAQKLEAIEKQKELVKRSIVETETLFNSRMDFWFNN